jgi:ABC-type amino acid transport substrate-binding protein
MGLMRNTPRGSPELTDGLIKDWQDALARELGRRPVTLILPRKRQDWAVEGRKVDLRCFVSPEWLTHDIIAQYDWPAPFMDVEERVVGPAGAPPIQTLQDLEGKTIGGVRGYAYRKLDPLFSSGRAKREDAPGETALLLKQLAGRTDVSLMRTLDFHYLRRTDPRTASLVLSPLVVSRFSMYCARTKYATVSLQALSAAQERLLQAGVLEKILQKYR